MIIVEILGAITTLVCVFLTIKNNIWAWPIGIISCIFYGIIFIEQKLYGDFFLQIAFTVQSIIAWINWYKPISEYPISWCSKDYREKLLSIVMIISISMIIILNCLSDPNVLMDSLTTVCSLTGVYLLSKRKIEAWIFWILTDLFFVFMFFEKNMWVSFSLYCTLTIMASSGLYKWIKEEKNTKTV